MSFVLSKVLILENAPSKWAASTLHPESASQGTQSIIYRCVLSRFGHVWLCATLCPWDSPVIKCLFLLAQKDMEATIRVVITVLPTQCSSLSLVTAPYFFRGDSTPLTQVRGFYGHIQFKYPHPPNSQASTQANQNPFLEFFYSALEKKSPFWASLPTIILNQRPYNPYTDRQVGEMWRKGFLWHYTLVPRQPGTHVNLSLPLALLPLGFCHFQWEGF